MSLPLLTSAIVIGYNEEQHSVFVSFEASYAGPGYPVRVGSPYSDGVRIRQNPLPIRGTWGLVAFPYGDDRSGIWICAINPNLVDAINATAGDPGQFYESMPCDIYSLIDKSANFLWSHPSPTGGSPDGTFIVINQDGQKPVVYRHIVDSATQVQQRIPFTDAQRQVFPAPYIRVHHSSGTDFQVDPSGNVTLTAAQSMTATVTGATTVNANGGATVNVTGDVSVIASGNAIIQAASIALQNAGTALQKLVNALFIDFFNSHTHSDPQGGNTGVPNNPASSAQLTSVTSAE